MTNMNRKLLATAVLLMAFPFLSMAQNKRNGIKARPKQLFTIEDLIPGGSTYYQNSLFHTLPLKSFQSVNNKITEIAFTIIYSDIFCQ